MTDTTDCVCGHPFPRHQDAALAPECLDCDCVGYQRRQEYDAGAYLESACAGLTAAEIRSVRMFLTGVFSALVGEDAVRVSPARWERYVALAIADARRA